MKKSTHQTSVVTGWVERAEKVRVYKREKRLTCMSSSCIHTCQARLPPLGPWVHVLGIDSSPRAIDRARARATSRGSTPPATCDFAVRDVLAEGCPPCDIAVSSLFLHHLDDASAVDVLSSMAAAARLGGAVSDLVRSRAGLVLAVLGTTLLARSRVARVDGPLSVRAARTPTEYRDLAARAGLPHLMVRRTWPERVMLEWRSVEAVDELVPGVACA